MPRSRSAARPAPARPKIASKPAVPMSQQQSRPNATYAAPAAAHPHAAVATAPSAASQGPGLFGQMASTAAGVAVGSSIGHAIGSLFSGGSSTPAEPAPAVAPAVQSNAISSQTGSSNCQGATQSFTKCMDEHGGNMSICGWYLEQLKACQAAASQY